MSNNKPILVAVVGRPNVGKSTLFNRLIKKRKAIETSVAGTTRDRLYGDLIWRGIKFRMIDSAGILFGSLGELESAAQESTKIAINEADIVIFTVDYKAGVTQIDQEIAKNLRKHPKTILAINKADNNFDLSGALAFRRLGFEHQIMLSAISGKNSGNLLDMMYDLCGDLIESEKENRERGREFNLSIIGRPNAGKSTLLNTIIGQNKVIVSSVAGTTRDSSEISFDFGGYKINLVDTAGIRRKSRVKIGSPDGYALLMSHKAIKNADVVVYLIDAKEGLVSIDQTLLGEIKKNAKSVILGVNKTDLWEDFSKNQMPKYIAKLQQDLNFMPWLPVVFISAKDNSNVKNLLTQCINAYRGRKTEVTNEDCQEILAVAKAKNSQINYITSLIFKRSDPIVFKISTKKNKKPHFSHLRYLENQIRDKFPLCGNPLFIDWLK